MRTADGKGRLGKERNVFLGRKTAGFSSEPQQRDGTELPREGSCLRTGPWRSEKKIRDCYYLINRCEKQGESYRWYEHPILYPEVVERKG